METAFKRAFGLASFDNKIFFCYQTTQNKPNEFNIDFSHDGNEFKSFSKNAHIDSQNLDDVSSFRFTKTGDQYNLFYLCRFKGKEYLNQATSLDFIEWKWTTRLFPITEPGVQIPFFSHKGKSVIYFGGKKLNIGLSENLKDWNTKNLDVEDGNYIVGSVSESSDGPLLIYFKNNKHGDHNHYSVWSVLLDKKDPSKVLWTTDKALWYQPQEWIDRKVVPIGTVNFEDELYSYWEYPKVGIFSIKHSDVQRYSDEKSELPHARLLRHFKNPILSPREEKVWDSKQVFNAAAVYHKGAVHLLYRAVGDHDTSVLGYAKSADGLTIDERSDKPAYVPRAEFEHPYFGQKVKTSPFESGGGGYGGIEDPRITKIDDKFYLTYVAYDGSHPPRVALSYISVHDFENKNWKGWSEPVAISPPGIVDKNACILPEKINDKYVIFHRIYPDILIDQVDSLDFDGKTEWLTG